MTGQQLINSEGRKPDFEPTNANLGETARTELLTVFSFNCNGLKAQWATPWRRAERGTQGERGGTNKRSRQWRSRR